VILYGSRARGDARPDSDWDALGIRDDGPAVRDARAWQQSWLDAWILPAAEAVASPALLHVRGGRVLVERDDRGRALLAGLEEVHARGPAPLTDAERTLRESWCEKTLARVCGAAPGDLEAAYRRAWLCVDLLSISIELRGRWYLGPRQALAELAAEDPEAHTAFAGALGGDDAALATLVRRTVRPPAPPGAGSTA
jgi:hypothetical protein